MHEILLRNYFVCFVDLLGQRAAMGKGYVLPPNESQERERLGKAVLKSMEAILFIQSNFANHIRTSSEERSLPPIHFDPEKKALFDRFRNPQVRIQQFSDGLVLFAALDADIGASISSFYSILTACSSLIIGGLARGYPFRAGLALGAAVSLSGIDIYGPALAEAYRLESSVADFPRVILSDSIHAWLKSFDASAYRSETEKKVSLALRDLCSRFLDVDENNILFLDYFSKNVRFVFENVEGGVLEIQQMREFVTKCKNDEQLGEKVRGKYSRLNEYLESRL